MSSRQLGFWPIFAIVIGSQIGSGVFTLPAGLAPYGFYGILGWVISGMGAICLALVFASLCKRFPETGGPPLYVEHVFGRKVAFFVGWVYWVISWVSSTVLVISSVAYLAPLVGTMTPELALGLEIGFLLAVTALNLQGVQAAGHAETILSFMKVVPLIVIPVAALFLFDASSIVVAQQVASQPISDILGKVTLLTLWGFIGLESATVPAGSVENASVTIPRAVIAGTLCTALLYLLNSIAVMGLIPGPDLAVSGAPYVDATMRLLGGKWHIGISLITFISILGTLNAWMLTSGQIAMGLAQAKLLPAIFGKRNASGAPVVGLILSTSGMLPLILLSWTNKSMAAQITHIIDFSVIAFLFIYIICILAHFKLQMQEGFKLGSFFYSSIALMFAVWVISKQSMISLLIASSFVLSAIPVYLFWFLRR